MFKNLESKGELREKVMDERNKHFERMRRIEDHKQRKKEFDRLEERINDLYAKLDRLEEMLWIVVDYIDDQVTGYKAGEK